MCYNVAQQLVSLRKQAIHAGAPPEEIAEIDKRIEQFGQDQHLGPEAPTQPYPFEFYLARGYDFPELLILKQELKLERCNWGLIPHWVKDVEQANQIRQKTLNARGESIFEKPSFRDSANSKRCVIMVSGFYEYHHKKGKNFPHFITGIDGLILGGLYSEWLDKSTGEIKNTFSIVTTIGNELMSEIHNNPKATGPRMPVILNPKDVDQWLHSKDRKEVEQLIKPLEDGLLKAHTVKPLSGKYSVGNTPEAQEEYQYPELNEQTELF